MNKYTAIIPAAGIGSRFQSSLPKQYHVMNNGKLVLENSLSQLLREPRIVKIVIAVHSNDTFINSTALVQHPKVTVTTGGKTRTESVYNALKMAPESDFLVVHDAVRPVLKARDLQRILDYVDTHNRGAILASRSASTVKQQHCAEVKTLDRDSIWLAQTPQVFAKNALLQAIGADISYTDESSAMDAMGEKYHLMEGDASNLKITTPQDLLFANQCYFQQRSCCGTGFDVHAFDLKKTATDIVLGGVRVAAQHPLKAHSDGDVLLHAICDALLGCASLGDIGRHFADTDSQFKNIDSRVLLRRVAKMLVENRVKIQHLDATVIAQKPKIASYIESMCHTIALDLNLELSRVNVKATTTERLGFTGRSEGIAALATAIGQQGVAEGVGE